MADEARLVIKFEGEGGGGSPLPGGLPAPSPAPGGGIAPGAIPGTAPGGGTGGKPSSAPPSTDAGSSAIIDLLRVPLPAEVNRAIDSAENLGGKASRAASQALSLAGLSSASMIVPFTAGAFGGVALASAAIGGNFAAARNMVGDFSPQLEAARAQSEVRNINRQIDAARLFGDELAGIEGATSRTQDRLLRAIMPLMERLLQVTELAANGLEAFLQFAEENVDALIAWAAPFGGGFVTAFFEVIKAANEILRKQKDRDNIFNAFDRFPHLPLPAEISDGSEVLTPGDVFFDGPILDMNFA
jgi:hypothetical protein